MARTPERAHAAVSCLADGQPSALETGRHPGSETSVGLLGQQQLYVRRSHMRSEPYHDELHIFRRDTEHRRHCGNEGWIRAVAESHCRHGMMSTTGLKYPTVRPKPYGNLLPGRFKYIPKRSQICAKEIGVLNILKYLLPLCIKKTCYIIH